MSQDIVQWFHWNNDQAIPYLFVVNFQNKQNELVLLNICVIKLKRDHDAVTIKSFLKTF